MPKGKKPLHSAEIELIKNWIAEGAKDDTPASAQKLVDADHPPLYTLPPVITSLDYSPDGKWLAVAGFHEVLLHKADGSGLAGRLIGMSERIESVRFSPDGNTVIMSMAKDGNAEIYTMDLRTRAVKRLTRHSAIDTSPYISPDGEKIVFNSDRSGGQQLYVMNADGSSVRRISFGKGRYATPVWSPRGDLIAFTKISGGRFFIGVMAPDGSGERLLADGFLVEAPTWAPNGRVLMVFRETPLAKKGGKRTRLFSIDLTGQNERQIVTPMDASDPAWSPLIP